MKRHWRVILATAALVGWLAYLGYAAAMRSRELIVSHSQASVASAAVVAELAGQGPTALVVEPLWGTCPQGSVEIVNLRDARGFNGPGQYLLYLAQRGESWVLVGQSHSPNNDLAGVGPPIIYPWTEDVRKQADKLRR